MLKDCYILRIDKDCVNSFFFERLDRLRPLTENHVSFLNSVYHPCRCRIIIEGFVVPE